MAEKEVGKVTHYFSHLGVAGVILRETLKVGDKIHILGHTTDLTQTVESMQVGQSRVERAESGTEIGLKVSGYVREHDTVFMLDE